MIDMRESLKKEALEAPAYFIEIDSDKYSVNIQYGSYRDCLIKWQDLIARQDAYIDKLSEMLTTVGNTWDVNRKLLIKATEYKKKLEGK